MKFKKFDEFISKKNEIDENSFLKDITKFYRDPTLWAYGVLTDKQNNPLKLRYYQDMLINDKNRFVFCAGSNQIGKTWSVCVKALHHALHVENASVIIVSKTESQATMVLDEIKWFMRRSELGLSSMIDNVENRTEVHFKVGKGISRIKCVPATEGALGFPATLMLCDEIAFWENGVYMYTQVIEPRTNETMDWKNKIFIMGQIICITNPNGMQGIGWNLWNDIRYNCYKFSWLANPKKKIEDYLRIKKTMPSVYFDSIYAAEFTSASGGFITQEEYERCISDYKMELNPSNTIYLGADFAGEDTVSRDTDFTVMYGINIIERKDEPPKLRVVWQKEYPRKILKENVYNDVSSMKSFIGKFAYDRVGVSDSIKNDLIDKSILNAWQIEALTYSLPNKTDVYTNLKHLFEQGRLEISKEVLPQLKEQLMGLKFELTKSGYLNKPALIIHHSSGFKDDHADAFANACYVALRLGMGEAYINKIEIGNTGNKVINLNGNSKEELVECDRCTMDFKYNGELNCIYCNADKSHLGYYTTGKRV
jgi:hypothetical protein